MIGGDNRSPTLDNRHAGEMSSLAPARHAIVEFLCRNGVGHETVERAELIVSELATNAVEASPGQDYRLTVAVDADGVVIRVRNRARRQRPPPPDSWGPDSPLAPRGRGLTIVEALADRLEIDRGSGTVEVAATIATAPLHRHRL